MSYKDLVISIVCLASGISTFAATPILSANATQACYDGTTKPILNIISGSAKTSYVSAAVNDPTAAAAIKGIYFTATESPTSFTITSSSTAVVPLANITMTLISGDQYVCKIKPTGVGYSTITIKANNGALSSTYTIKFAASAASAYAANTIYPTGIADASAAAAIDDNYMFVADDETNLLRLFNRKESGQAVYSVDITTAAGGITGEEFDLEGATNSSAAFNSGKRIYWIASLGNSKSGGLKPYRDRIIATDISGTGANTTLSVKGYSDKMRTALITWGDANTWNFTASAATGMIAKRIDGLNIEGLSLTNAGEVAYIGFRAPCVPIKGTTPTSGNRLYAVIAPVTNFETMMNASGKSTVTPTVSEPILFNFNGLGIRSIERVGGNKYLIEAGLFEGGGTPAVYLWDGTVPANSGTTPISVGANLIKLPLDLTDLVQASVDGGVEGHPEALIADQIGDNILTHLICDNGTVDYYGDAIEAKALPNPENMKFRMDTYVYSLTGAPALLLTAGDNTQSVNDGNAISNIIYTWGGAATGVTVTGLPTGLTTIINTAGKNLTIGGTATQSGTFNYSVTTTQASGTAAVLTGTIDIIPVVAPTLVLTSGSSTQSVAQGNAISDIVYTWGDGATDVNITGLTSGFTATKNTTAKTVTISGSSSSVLSATTFTLTTVGTAPAVTLTGSITVTADPNAAAMSASGGSLTQTVVPGNAITPIILSWAGGSTGIDVIGLPAGLSSVTDNIAKTVTISGTPTAGGNFSAITQGGTQAAITVNGTITVGSSATETFESVTSTVLATGSDKTQDLPINGLIWKVEKARLMPTLNNTAGGTNSIRLNYINGVLVTPLLAGSQTFSFYVSTPKDTKTVKVEVYLSTDGGTTWGSTAIFSEDIASVAFLKKSVIISEATDVKLKICNKGGTSGSSDFLCYIDDVEYTKAATATSMQEASSSIRIIQQNDELQLIGTEASELQIITIEGQVILTEAGSSINISSLAKGVYVVMIQTKSGELISKKFIKQ